MKKQQQKPISGDAVSEIKRHFDKKTEETKFHFDKKTEEAKRHFDVVAEGLNDKISIIAEQYGDIKNDIKSIKKTLDSHTETLDSHTEMIGKVMEDMTVVKMNIEFIKGALKKKVDHEEFEALERRVTFMEAKARR